MRPGARLFNPRVTPLGPGARTGAAARAAARKAWGRRELAEAPVRMLKTSARVLAQGEGGQRRAAGGVAQGGARRGDHRGCTVMAPRPATLVSLFPPLHYDPTPPPPPSRPPIFVF